MASRDLDRPPLADSNQAALELLRVWAAPDSPQQLTLRTCWGDPASWGLLLVDIARHAAQAYGRQGVDASMALRRIYEAFDLERSSPSSDAEDLTDEA